MTPKQNKQFNLMASTLRQIARGFQTTSQLRRNSMKDWGLSYDEALEMAYENIQEIAKRAVKGVKDIPQLPKGEK
jgi:methyl-accepting chemotaxis protein|nr:MAG TPA: Non structural protein Nsp1 [Caudoviricetes sp.]